MLQHIINFDHNTSLFLQSLDSEFLRQFSIIYSSKTIMALVVLLVIMLIIRKNIESGAKALQMLIIGFVLYFIFLEPLIKEIFFRTRPYLLLNEIQALGALNTNSSLPSSHVAFTTFICLTILNESKKYYWLAFIIIPAMMFSRIYNGMHFISDTIAGLLVGIGLYFFVQKIGNKINWHKFLNKKIKIKL